MIENVNPMPKRWIFLDSNSDEKMSQITNGKTLFLPFVTSNVSKFVIKVK